MIAPFAQAQELRTQQDHFTGYKAEAFAAPITVQIFEQLAPVPVDPGEPQVAVSANHSNSTLNTGPLALALASTAWPGDGIGFGFEHFQCTAEGEDPQKWPFMALATYPQANEQGTHTAESEPGMSAAALGLDIHAESAMEGELIPGVLKGKAGRGFTSGSITEDGLALARAEAFPGAVTMMDGLVTITGFRTVVEAESDGVTARVDSAQEAGSITIAGTTYTVDDSGIRREPPADDEDPFAPLFGEDAPLEGLDGVPLGLDGDVDVQELLGVRVEAVPDTTVIDGARAEHTIGGVAITLDFGPLKDILDLALPTAQDVLAMIIEQFPEDPPSGCDARFPGSPVQGPRDAMEFALALTDFRSEIRLVVGRAGVEVSAVQPPVINLPPPPPPPPPPPSFGGVAPDVTTQPPPVSAPPPANNNASTPVVEPDDTQVAIDPVATEHDFFTGLPWGMVFLVLGVFGLFARGLHHLTIGVFGEDAGALSLRG